jgi:hypothetical protein
MSVKAWRFTSAGEGPWLRGGRGLGASHEESWETPDDPG